MGFIGLKSRCCQGHVFLEAVGENLCSLPFPSSRLPFLALFLLSCSLPSSVFKAAWHLASSSHCLLLQQHLPLLLSYKNAYNYIQGLPRQSPSQDPQPDTYAKYFLLYKVIFPSSRDQDLDIFGSCYSVYQPHCCSSVCSYSCFSLFLKTSFLCLACRH